MTDSFEFENTEFELLEVEVGPLHIKIDRCCRTEPYIGMKQPIPPGAIMGLEVVLDLWANKKRSSEYSYILYDNDNNIVSEGIINNGKCILPIPMPPKGSDRYRIDIDECEVECNTGVDE